MSTTSGVFTETTLQAIRVMADKILMDGRVKLQFEPRIEILKQALQYANKNLKVYFSPKEKDYVVDIEWMNACALEAQECSNCSPGGAELSTNIETKTLSGCKEVPFTIYECDFLTNDFNKQEAIAKALLRADVLLLEQAALTLITSFNTVKGVNQLAPGSARGCVSGNDTYILPSFWTYEIMSYFQRAAQMNQFRNPVMFSGANLHERYLSAKFMAGAEANAFNGIPIFFDEWNIDTVNTPNFITYMIEAGSYAFITKSYYEPADAAINASLQVGLIKDLGFEQRWSMRSRFLPDIWYDVHRKTSCDAASDFAKEDWVVKLKGGAYMNPAGCDEDNTGALTFICGACPS